jgi:hypothetical protein
MIADEERSFFESASSDEIFQAGHLTACFSHVAPFKPRSASKVTGESHTRNTTIRLSATARCV